MKVYLAGPLFTLAEQRFNAELATILRADSGISVVLPQERAPSLLKLDNGMVRVFQDCLEMVDACDAVVAILDGPDADSGTCIELGYAFAKRRPVVGIRTDFRGSEDRGLNLMVSNICETLIVGNPGDVTSLAQKLVIALSKFMPPNAAV